MDRIKVALVGCGYWGKKLLRVLHEVPKVDVKRVVDVNPEAVEEVKERYPGVLFSQNLEDILKDDEIHAVLVATPVKEHYPIARELILSGKDVFIEKPFTYTSQEAEELIRLAEERERIIMVGHTYQYSPRVRKIKELLKEDEMGKPVYITSRRMNLGIHRYDVNVIWDLAPHDLSILYFLLEEEPERVNLMTRSLAIENHPDVAFIGLEFPSGTIAHVELSWVAPLKVRDMVIVCEKKMIVYRDTEPQEPVRVYDKGVEKSFREENWYLTYRMGSSYAPYIPPREPLRVEMEEFVECVSSRKKPLSDGRMGLAIVRMMEKIERRC